MTDQEFLDAIYAVAEELKEYTLTDDEKTSIIKVFNNLEGTNYQRAKKAIETVTGIVVPERFALLEKAGSINNLQNLVSQMQAAANEWKKK
jgi:hypothetical protein